MITMKIFTELVHKMMMVTSSRRKAKLLHPSAARVQRLAREARRASAIPYLRRVTGKLFHKSCGTKVNSWFDDSSQYMALLCTKKQAPEHGEINSYDLLAYFFARFKLLLYDVKIQAVMINFAAQGTLSRYSSNILVSSIQKNSQMYPIALNWKYVQLVM